MCAPLTIGDWVIFIEVKEEVIKYGLIDAELSETSPSLYDQTVGSFAVDIPDIHVAYLRNIGSKTVELVGLKRKLIISLTLDKVLLTERNYVNEISSAICMKLDEEIRDETVTYINKTINEAIKEGHGNLVGVIDIENIQSVKDSITDGIYLNELIDIASLLEFTEREKTNESSVALRSYGTLFKSMLNHDGITILTNTGQVICYHLFIQPFEKDGEPPVGGARSRAYQSMLNSGLFVACFYKSQDGNAKIWNSYE